MSGYIIIKDVNLLVSLNKKPRKIEKKKSSAKTVLALVLSAALMACIYSYLIYQTDITEKKIEKSEGVLKNSENIADHDTYEKVFADSVTLNVRMLEMKNAYESFHKTAPMNMSVLEKVISSLDSGNVITSYVYSGDTKELKLKINSDKVSSISSSVTRIRKTGVFSNVSYVGYDSTGTKAKYSYELVCRIADEE